MRSTVFLDRACWVVVGLAVLLAGSLSALAQEGEGIPVPEQAASASPRLKFLPSDYWFVGELDCRLIMQALGSDEAKQNPQYAQFAEALKLVKSTTGIDPETELEFITLFACGDPEDAPKVLGVVQGPFKRAKAEAQVKESLGDDANPEEYKGRKIYGAAEMNVCFVQGQTILVGDKGLIHEAIDQLENGDRRLPEGLHKVLDRTNSGLLVWAAVRPAKLLNLQGIADWREKNPELVTKLLGIDSLSLVFDLNEDGLGINALGYLPKQDEGPALHEYLTKAKRDLLHTQGSNVVFTTLLILADLKNDGPYVRGSLRLTGSALTDLWNTKVIVKPQ